jgi:hypothetical protein
MIRQCFSRLSNISILYTLFAVVFSLLVVYSAQASTVKSEYNWDNGTTQSWTSSSTASNTAGSLQGNNNGNGSLQIFAPTIGFALEETDVITFDFTLLTYSTAVDMTELTGSFLFSGDTNTYGRLKFDLGLSTRTFGETVSYSFTVSEMSYSAGSGSLTRAEFLAQTGINNPNIFITDDPNNGNTASALLDNYAITAPSPAALTPVPTLPLFGLGILVSLLGLFGLRKLRQ